jgi:hypothetical protein
VAFAAAAAAAACGKGVAAVRVGRGIHRDDGHGRHVNHDRRRAYVWGSAARARLIQFKHNGKKSEITNILRKDKVKEQNEYI